MNKKKILLIGGGGHCKSVIDVLEERNEFSEIGLVDATDKIGSEILGYSVIGCDDDLKSLFEKGYTEAFITLGSIGNYKRRVQLYKLLKNIGYQLPNIISKSAIVSRNIDIGVGNFIGKGSIVNVSTQIGDNTIINSGSLIEHDCCIADYVHIAPATTLSGGVSIGYGSHIGTNSTVIQNIKIGSNTIIGAGSVVVKDLDNDVIAYGLPCKEMKSR